MSKLSIEAELAQGDAKVRELAKSASKPQAVQAAPDDAQEPVEAPAEEEVVQEPEAVVEAAGDTEEPEVPADEEEADKRFTLLAEREVKLRTLEKEVKEKESNLGKSVTQLRKEIYADIVKLLDDDPQGFFDEAGKKYEDISKKMLEKRPDPTALRLKKEVNALQEKIRQQEEQRAQAKQRELLEEARKETRQFVDGSEAHPLTKAAGMYDEVLEVIQVHYSETGQELSYDAAADRVEAYLTDLVDKLTPSKPLKAKAKAAPEQRPAKQTASPTLKNKQAATNPTRGTGFEELLPRQESIERASRLIRFLPKE